MAVAQRTVAHALRIQGGSANADHASNAHVFDDSVPLCAACCPVGDVAIIAQGTFAGALGIYRCEGNVIARKNP
jgi:hypothetical protein